MSNILPTFLVKLKIFQDLLYLTAKSMLQQKTSFYSALSLRLMQADHKKPPTPS